MMKPVVLIILDGWGIAPPGPGNAISQAEIPYFKKLWASFPHGVLQASGEAVGLPRGEDGNTETGHLNLGAGRMIYQDLPRINMAIADGSFYKNKAFIKAIDHAKNFNSRLHLLGLVGAGGVHSNIEHLLALLRLCKEQNFRNVFLHLFTDGRDSPPTSSKVYLTKIRSEINILHTGKIATICGRYYALDRDRRWDRTEKAYKALVEGKGLRAKDPFEAIDQSYKKGKTDEFIEPTVIVDIQGKPIAKVSKNDALIFFNFRIDRPRQLSEAFVLEDFEKNVTQTIFDPYADKYLKKHLVSPETAYPPFQRGIKIDNLFFATMTEYEKNLAVSAIAFPPFIVKSPLGKILADQGLRQLRMAETEKERFVTFYFNGSREKPFLNEERVIIPSPKVPTYDLKPEMSAYQLTKVGLDKIKLSLYEFILINFANPDMVSHTGNITAAIKSCEVIDECLKKIVMLVTSIKGACLITADHGNIEEMINHETGEVDTEHSNSLVPFIACANKFLGKPRDLGRGVLADIAPTILALLQISKPAIMTGRNLLANI